MAWCTWSCLARQRAPSSILGPVTLTSWLSWPKRWRSYLGAIDLLNRIIHGYDAVDAEIVYLAVTNDLGVLKTDLTRLLAARGWVV